MEFTKEELSAQRGTVERMRSAAFNLESEVRSMTNVLESRRRSLGALQMELVVETKILKKMEESRGVPGKMGVVREQAGDQPGGNDE